MDRSSNVKEMSFCRPHPAVELIERTFEVGNENVVCLASDESRLFIVFKLFQETWRRDRKAGKMVFLVDDEKDEIVEQFLNATSHQGMLSVNTYFDETAVVNKGRGQISSCIILTKGEPFQEILRAGIMDLTSVKLIVFDKCHLACDPGHPFAILLRYLEGCVCESKPRIVGISSEMMQQQACPEDLERFLISLEEQFHCKASISNGLLALNRYGEQVEVEVTYYTYTQPQKNELTYKIMEVLQRALVFLKDIPGSDATSQECVLFMKHIFAECCKVLLLFGPLQIAYVSNLVLKELKKLEKRCSRKFDLLTVQFCQTQANLILKISTQDKLQGEEYNSPDAMTKLLFYLSTYLKQENTENIHNADSSFCNRKDVCVNSPSSQQPKLAENPTSCLQSHDCPSLDPVPVATSQQNQRGVQSTYGAKNYSDDPLCIVLVPSVIVAKALNSLINKLSNSRPKYSFLKSACVDPHRAKQGMIEHSLSVDTNDNVLECVRDGSVNIVVSTFEIEEEIYVRRCSLLIRLGMPKDFNGYINVKKKVRSSEAKVVFLVNEEEKYKEEERFKVFHEIEHILLEKCYNTSRPSCHEIQKLFQQEPSEAYEPFGKDLLSSISLVNSYCSKFPSSGVGAPVPYCRTQEIWSDSKVQFVSTLYLPRNSPVYWPIQVTSTYSRNDMNKETLRKATIKSEMLVAMETCRQLLKAGELDDDLQPISRSTQEMILIKPKCVTKVILSNICGGSSRFQVFRLAAENEKCDWEVVDCGMGMDGSVKRNRVYIRKFPSILEDNLPVCGGPSFLYSITMELTKPLTFERAARSRSKGHPSGDCYSLGILCRRTLPKLPGMVIFDRAGEVTATITECRRNPFVPSLDQLALIQRFTGFIFKEIAKPGNTSTKTFPKFDPSVATSGYYVVLLKNSEDGRSSRADGLDAKEIAFDFMQSIEKALGSFDSPADPAPAGIQDMEKFADAVVTAVYNDKRLRYYVADICYDRSPVDPFPNQDAAATFAEYYQKRYGIQVTLDQPLLDVDHISSRLNFLLPRYQSIKGHELSFPWKDSRRSQKAQLYVVPELCSIHPLPAYLWRWLFLLPSVLYRMESLLVAEEFRSLVARGLGGGAVDWPNEVPLPLVTLSETMGEDMLSQSNSFLEDSKKRDPSVVDSDKAVNLCFQPASGIGEDKRNPRHSTDLIKEMIVQRRDFEEVEEVQQTAAELTPRNKKPSPLASSEVKVDFEDFNWSDPAKHDTSVDKEIVESSHINIWTDSRLSLLYQTCGPSSTLILRALTPGSAGDVFSLERLEMLGDSFIKYAISCSVFFQQPHENEGKLSFIRGLKVSNRQLFYLARRRGLPSYMFPHMFDLFVNWLPPGFYYEDNDDTEGVNESELLLMPVKSSQNMEDDEEEEDECIFAQEGVLGETDNPEASIDVEDHSSSIQLSAILHHRCSDKAVADALEALVGAYLLTLGTEGAWSFLQWLGIDPNKQEDGRDVQGHSSSFVQDSSPEEDKEFYSTAGRQEMSKRPCSALQSCDVQCTSTGKDKDFDSTASRQEVSKRPCSAFQTSDESLSQWTCEILQIAPLEKALNCSRKGAPDASGKRKNQALPDKMHDSLLEKRIPWTNSLWTPHESASNSQSSFHVSDDSLFQEKTALYSLQSNSAFLPSEKSSSAEFEAIEEVLRYKFHNRLLLEQAFTHTSLPRDYNVVRSSYEQLEFLGDALLDFLVTRYLYIHQRHKSPGDLTDLRSAVVNNFSFAALAVKLGFAKHLQSLSPQLFKIVNKFIEKFEEKTSNNEICSSVIVLANEDSEEFVEVEVPKVLGDLFEAVAGALYVDCGQDLSKVWEIYLPILKPSIDYHSANPPMSATRKLLEMKPNASKFAPVERMVDGTFRSSLTVAGFGTFVGIGRNFQIAKSTAAQKALAALRKR